MQGQQFKLTQYQAGNEQARKKLQFFRSGLQKMMSKKSKKPLIKHQAPSHDTKHSAQQNKKNQYIHKQNVNITQSPKSQISKQLQFDYNSTLFKQIGNDSIIMSNSSNNFQNGLGNSQFNYNSNREYFSNTTNKTHIQPNQPIQDLDGGSFKNSLKLFSQIDQLMNKVNATSKLPVKPIQKYFFKNQHKKSNSQNTQDFQIKTTKNYGKVDQQDYFSNNSNKQSQQYKLNTINQSQQTKRQKKGEKKPQAQKPPLPSSSLSKWPSFQQKQKPSQFNKTQLSYKNHNKNLQPQIISNKRQNSVELHRNRLKETLSQRKKIQKDDIVDDSVLLEFSDDQDTQRYHKEYHHHKQNHHNQHHLQTYHQQYQRNQTQNKHQHNISNQQKNDQQAVIYKLKQEKSQLLNQLALIQQELEAFQSNL